LLIARLAMGNPYLADDFPTIQNYICTFSDVTVSEVSAARALFGEIPMSGQMPVNLTSVVLKIPGERLALLCAPPGVWSRLRRL
jgi:hypothetical protein